ncbi:MAG: hypothetical protein GY863_09420 [bacterium]|nr:hypothetical protein [bacterium]
MNSKNINCLKLLPILVLLLSVSCSYPDVSDDAKYDIPVVIVKYYPVKDNKIDIDVTGDWGISLSRTRGKVDGNTLGIIAALEEGSKYHGYKDPTAVSSLDYRVVQEYEFLEPLPTYEKEGHQVPMTDYNLIVNRINGREWVEEKGVKEIWIWGYHGGEVDLWESNMAGPYGDISNSDRDPDDLPVYKNTYTVYHYNYQRDVSEAIENHMHQLEAVLNCIDGRDETPSDNWDKLLYWGRFVGSDRTHKIIEPRAGWSHYPPNAERDYDWANPRYVRTDIENWNPQGTGEKVEINSERWDSSSLKWFIYWMQNHPGMNNGLEYEGSRLTNWWMFIGDFDNAMEQNSELTAKK